MTLLLRYLVCLALALGVTSLSMPGASIYHTAPGDIINHHVALERHKRYLLYPDGDPARVQFIIGLGLPLDLADQSVTIGYVIKILFHVPQEASDYSKHAHDSASNADRKRRSLQNNQIRFNDTANKENDEEKGERKLTYSESAFNSTSNVDIRRLKRRELRHNNSVSEIINKDKAERKNNEEKDNERHFGKNKVIENKMKKDEEKTLINIKIKKSSEGSNSEDNHEDGFKSKILYSEGGRISEDGEDEKYKRYLMEVGRREKDRKEKLTRLPKTTRWGIYKILETMVEHNGLSGRACVLRAICEAADTPFTHHNGLLGELMHIILTPSTSQDGLSCHADNEYHAAEKLGGDEGSDCERLFPECTESLLEMFSEVGIASVFG